MNHLPIDWTHRIRLRHLQILLSLTHTQNISHSALALNMTQPGLSKWLKELEDDIGVPLFQRHARGLRPTAYGDALIAHARRIDAHISNARDEMASLARGGGRIVRIGTSGAATANTVPMAILKLLKQMPDAKVKVTVGTMDELMDQLDVGEIDIVVGGASETMRRADVQSQNLYPESLHFVTRPGHPLLRHPELRWSELLEYSWVLWPQGTPIRDAFDIALSASKQDFPLRFVESSSVTVNLALLNSSDMISIASHKAATRFEQMNVMAVLPLEFQGMGSVAMCWRDDAVERPAVAEALRAVRHITEEQENG